MSERKAKSAALLRRLMAAEDLTHELLAYQAGVSAKTISRWLSPTWPGDPGRITIERVAERFKLKPGDLWPRLEPAELAIDGATDGDGDARAQLERIEGKLDDLLELLATDRDAAGETDTESSVEGSR